MLPGLALKTTTLLLTALNFQHHPPLMTPNFPALFVSVAFLLGPVCIHAQHYNHATAADAQVGERMARTAAGSTLARGVGASTSSALSTDTVTDLTIPANTRTDLARSLYIEDSLVLGSGGKLQLGTFTLTMATGAKIVGADSSGYVVTNGSGALVRPVSLADGIVSFPVGNSSYNPMLLSNYGTADDFSVQVRDQVLEDGTTGSVITKNVVERTWLIEEATAGGSDVSVTMWWHTSDELIWFDRSKCGIAHFISSSWQDPPAPASAKSEGDDFYSQSRTGITSFSPFAVEDGALPLPVELVRFEAERTSSSEINLYWETASELNNSGFEVQTRSQTNQEIAVAGWLTGAGTTAQWNNYELSVNNTSSNITYYRLRQLDNDGSEHFSQWLAVDGAAVQAPKLRAWPNPARDQVTISLIEGAAYSIYNSMAQPIKTGRLGALSTRIDLSDFPAGTYIIRAFDGTNWHAQQLIKSTH